MRPLDARQWALPTRCEGWTVADVSAHVVGGLADVVSGRLEGVGSPEWIDRQVAERQGRSPADLADELEQVTKVGADVLAGFDEAAWNGPAPGGSAPSVAQGVEALYYDAYVH